MGMLESHREFWIRIVMEKREALSLLALLSSSLLIRVLLFPLTRPGYRGDLFAYKTWLEVAVQHGPRAFYTTVGWCDYPPFNVYIFWVFGSLAQTLSLFGSDLIVYALKLPPNLFDTVTAFLIFAFARKRFDFKTSMLTTAFYAFNPAVVFDSSVWGQYDAIYTFFLVLSLLLLLDSKPKLSAMAFTLGLLIKPQSIALAPLICFLIFRMYGWQSLLASLLAAAATTFAVIIPLEWSNPVTFLTNIYFGAYGGYPVTSANAFNIWALGGLWRSDTQDFLFLNLVTVGWLMFGALAAYILYVLHKHLDASRELLILYSAFMLLFGFFMLPTRIHERYLFPALSVLTLMVPFSKKIGPIYVALTFTCLVNQAYVLLFLYKGQSIQFADPVLWMVTLINIAVFLYALMLMPKNLQEKETHQVAGMKLQG
jgi:Gpi18-like mannosyltransferase